MTPARAARVNLTEVADRRYVGTALTAQTALGFLLTIVTIQGLPVVVEALGWRGALALLAIGPASGTTAMALLHRDRAEIHERWAVTSRPADGAAAWPATRSGRRE